MPIPPYPEAYLKLSKMVSIVNFLPYFLMKSGSSVRAEHTLSAALVLSTSNW